MASECYYTLCNTQLQSTTKPVYKQHESTSRLIKEWL